MVARQTMLVTIASADDLDELEQALGVGELECAVIDIPENASVLEGARELRKLVDLARLAGVELEFSTDDPLRRELIRILGYPLAAHRVFDAPVTPTEPAAATEPDAETRRIGADVSPDDDTRPSTTYRPWQIPHDDPTAMIPRTHEQMQESEPSFSFVLTPPGVLQFGSQQDELAAGIVRDMSYSGEWRVQDVAPIRVPSPRRLRTSRRLAMLSVIFTMALTGGLFAAILAPSATVTITPSQETIATELTYGVAQPGRDLDIAVQPEPISAEIAFSASAPTTGERFVPDGTARGTVQLTNPLTWEIVVPAGTSLTGDNGVAYNSVEDVVVPAADPWGSLTFGTAVAEVVAVVAGSEGNLDAELLSGQLDSGVFYLNREAIGGGTNRRIATVSQADIDGLRQRAMTELERQARDAIAARLQPAQKVLAGSEQHGAVQMKFDHEVGADAEQLRVEASLVVSVQAYSLDDLHERARGMIAGRLAEQAGEDDALLSDTLIVSQPQELAGANGTAFFVRAEARAQTSISSNTLEELRRELAGMDEAEALARIRQVPGVGDATIDTSSNWLGDGLPRLASRIDIRMLHAGNVSTQTTPSGS